MNPADSELWEKLRELRNSLAREQGVPPYVIFHDATLMELVEQRPTSLEHFATISGVGKAKLERYGSTFIALIREFQAETPAQPSLQKGASELESLELLRRGLSPEAIAETRDLKLTTIYTHLSKLIEEGELELAEVVPLDQNRLDQIMDVLVEHALDEDKLPLRPVHDYFDGIYSYELLSCVRAALRRSMRSSA